MDFSDLKNLQNSLFEAERARQHATLLARVSMKLSSSLEYEVNLARIAQLTVPLLGDWCLIHLVRNGSLSRVSVIHADPEAHLFAEALKCAGGHSFDSKLRESVVESKTSVVISDFNQKISGCGSTQELSVFSVMVVPMLLRERLMGTLTFFITRGDKSFSPTELTLAEEIAYLAAISIDNSMLYSQAQDAIAARDHFFSVISHELKTPLTALSLQYQLLLRSLTQAHLAQFSKQKLEDILNSSLWNINRVDRLICDFLDISSIQKDGLLSVSLKRSDLSLLVMNMVGQYSVQFKAAQCAFELDLRGPCFLLCDPVRIDQVLCNLFNNAIKYASGHKISIKVEPLDSVVCLQICDDGPGIPKQDQSDIFKKYKRSASVEGKTAGLGLGLYIVDEIVRAHSGSIRLESEPGQGAKFRIYLPRELQD